MTNVTKTVWYDKLSVTSNIKPFSDEICHEAASILARGGVVCFPTETVYALAASPFSDEAIHRIYTIKSRDPGKPLALLASDFTVMRPLLEITPPVLRLAAQCSPGPVTYVLRRVIPSRLSPVMRLGETVGVRIPSCPMARAILAASGDIVVATSMNRSGDVSATQVSDIPSALAMQLDLIIDGGPSALRHASTVIDATEFPPRLLREGAMLYADILRLL